MSKGKAVESFINNLSKGTLMEGNKAINSLTSGFRMIENVASGKGVTESFDNIFRHAGNKIPPRAQEMLKHAGKEVPNELGKLNYGKIAGGYMGLSAGARVIGGGGLTRDRDGKPDIIGVPFV